MGRMKGHIARIFPRIIWLNGQRHPSKNLQVLPCPNTSLWEAGYYIPYYEEITIIKQKNPINAFIILTHELLHWLFHRFAHHDSWMKIDMLLDTLTTFLVPWCPINE